MVENKPKLNTLLIPWYKTWWGVTASILILLSVIVIATNFVSDKNLQQKKNTNTYQQSENPDSADNTSSDSNQKNSLTTSTAQDKQLDPRVTQGNIKTTICVSGYTKTVRPSTSYTGPIKSALMARVGATKGSDYELDHYIPLALGGSSDSANLWLEPIAEAKVKDKLEVSLQHQVCSGIMSLFQGQQKIRESYSIY